MEPIFHAFGNLNISSSSVAACQAEEHRQEPALQRPHSSQPAGAPSSGLVRLIFGSSCGLQFLNGNLARNAGKGHPFYRFDLSLTRSFPIRERVRIELRADFFNIFNHTNFLGFNALDALANFSVPSLTIPVDPNNPSGAHMLNPAFNANCTGCLNPPTGQFIGGTGRVLKIQDLQHGRVSLRRLWARSSRD